MNRLTEYNSYPVDSYYFLRMLDEHGWNVNRIAIHPEFPFAKHSIYYAFEVGWMRKGILDAIVKITGISKDILLNTDSVLEKSKRKKIDKFLVNLTDDEKNYLKLQLVS